MSQTISVLDILPTLVSAVGIEAGGTKALDGVDRWAQIQGAEPVPPGEIFFGVNGVVGRQEALRVDRWKLVRTLGFPGDAPRVMLFDVENDPLEQRDLSIELPERVADLRARLDRWLALYPPGGAQGIHWPHPGWIPPIDYRDAVRSDPAFLRP